ncbi:DUF3800 domain-containing protein [Enterococcus faecalis]|uniref:DUF3800 domain-containing protein n=1 Tax=Enterococcus faecalis TaxID=1351 RepID=UPI0020911EC6|nr:DUF3800 domain-containing protein [Enterococcus faecalis]
MEERLLVSIDESGNTGSNWLDPAQPFFIYGCWLIKDENRKEIEELVKEWKNGRQQTEEYKSNKLFKTNKSKKSLENLLLEILDKNLADPFFYVMEKRFMIAAKIVETFFDPAYSNYFSNQLTWPLEIKRKIANIIVRNGKDCFFENFLKLLSQKTTEIELMRSLRDDLSDLFDMSELMEISILIRNLNDESLIKMKDEFESLSLKHGKNFLTLTVPGIIQLFHHINLFSELNDYTGVDVIHDNLRGYDSIFQNISQDLFSDGREIQLTGINGRYMSNNFTKLKEFSWEDSKHNTFIQLADFLNGFIQYTAKKSLFPGETLSSLEKKIWEKFLNFGQKWGNKDESGLKTWDLVVSYKYNDKFLSLIQSQKFHGTYDTISSIKEEFTNYITLDGFATIDKEIRD